MRVRVLGGFSVDGLSERELSSRKGRTLLKVLALARSGPVPVDRLADVLWGDAPPARPADQVGVLVSRLRSVLGADRLVRTDAGYALVVDWLDLDELAARVREASEALESGRVGAARAAADAALALARGTVLPEEGGCWVETDRTAALALTAAARRLAAEAALKAGEVRTAVALAEHALAHDGDDEATLRVLMRAHTAAGRRASALAAYVRVRERLADDLGVDPSPETERLHDAIVLGDVEVPSPSGEAGGAPPVGRGAELTALDAALERVDGQPRPVCLEIVGEGGIGKTTLVENWARRLGGEPFVLLARCDELGRDLPLQPVVQALAIELAGVSEQERADVLANSPSVLRGLLGADTVPGPRFEAVPTDSEYARASLFAGLADIVGRLAAGRVAVLVVEDLHLAGPSTLAWLRFLAGRPLRLLLVTTRRPGGDPLLGDSESLLLGPLSLDAVITLVGPSRAHQLHTRSGGHPLLLWALAANDDVQVSPSLHAAVERRVSGLGPAANPLRVAAVLGAEIDLDLLADVLEAPVGDLLEHLEAGVTAGILVERGTGFAFRHDLEREVLEGALSAPRRSLVHRAAARALAARPSPEALAVVVHARLGGDAALAVEWLVRAADTTASRFELNTAESYLDEALALGGDSAAWEARARVRMARSRFDEAAEDAATAVRAGGGASALEASAWVAYYRRRPEEALLFADEGLRRADDERVRVSCLAVGGRARHATGELRQAMERLELASRHSSSIGPLAAVWSGQALVHAGRPADALLRVGPALLDPAGLAHPFAPLVGHFVRVMALGQLGRVDEALRACDEMELAVRERGEAGERMAAPGLNCRSWLLRWSGQSCRADELSNEAIMRASGGTRDEARYVALLDLAVSALLAGDLAALAASLERLDSPEWSGTSMAWHQRHRWRLLQAQLALAGGDRQAAAELAGAVATDAARRGARRYELLATAVNALAGGEPAGDRRRLQDVVDGLGACAVIDGWPLISALAARFEVPRWHALADQHAATVIDRASDRSAAQALVRRLRR